jgi:phage shock protein PspC (stress-responsive transcriptional regulator)
VDTLLKMIDKIQAFFEKQAFGVCEYMGEKFGLESSNIRKFFIYLSFITFGSPIVVYLVLAFLLENRKYFKNSRNSIWDL